MIPILIVMAITTFALYKSLFIRRVYIPALIITCLFFAYWVAVTVYRADLHRLDVPETMVEKVAKIPWQDEAYLKSLGLVCETAGTDSAHWVRIPEWNPLIYGLSIYIEPASDWHKNEADFCVLNGVKYDSYANYSYYEKSYFEDDLDTFINKLNEITFAKPNWVLRRYSFVIGDIYVWSACFEPYDENLFEDFLVKANP